MHPLVPVRKETGTKGLEEALFSTSDLSHLAKKKLRISGMMIDFKGIRQRKFPHYHFSALQEDLKKPSMLK
jgi:hypothetical protein